jgi:hypothetical protein
MSISQLKSWGLRSGVGAQQVTACSALIGKYCEGDCEINE